MNETNTATEIQSMIDAYAVHGGDGAASVAVARELRAAAASVVEVSIARIVRRRTVYRLVRLADGRRFLACRRGTGPLALVFSVARAQRIHALAA